MVRYTVVLSPESGGFVVTVPALPGAASQGDSREEAIRNIAEAITGWLDAASEAGEAPPEETVDLVALKIGEMLRYRAELGLDATIETAVVALTSEAAA